MRFLFICLTLACAHTLLAQEYVRSQQPVCILETAWTGDPKVKIEAPKVFPGIHQRTLQPGFEFTYLTGPDPLDPTRTCGPWPADAMAAIEYAAGIWGDLLTISVPIKIDACWTNFNSAVTLASAGPTGSVSNGASLFPVALANNIENNDFNGTLSEIEISINSGANWYFGTDGNPSGANDLVTTALHEIAHGLGFQCSARPDTVIFPPTFAVFADPPYISDNQYQDATGGGLLDIPDSSAALLQAIQGLTGGLYVTPIDSLNGNTGNPVPMYTPNPWTGGQSLSHYSEDSTSTLNELMSAITPTGSAIHNPGRSLHFLQNIGWLVNLLPVDLISFTAHQHAEAVTLRWTTASEIDIAEYIVQRSNDLQRWQEIDQVPAATGAQQRNIYHAEDHKPLPDINYYRLKISHTDASYEYSNVVEVRLDKATQKLMVHPNPVAESLTLEHTLGEGNAELLLIAMDGRPVLKTTLEHGVSTVDVAHIASGKYVLEVRVDNSVGRLHLIKL